MGAILGGLWLVFLAVWLVSSTHVKRSASSSASTLVTPTVFRLLLIVLVALLVRESLVSHAGRHVHGAILSGNRFQAVVGVALCAVGIAIAIWARFCIGQNWGMPMSLREGHELVTTGPYAFVRHPIYTGILLALAGTTLTVGHWSIALFPLYLAYFIYAATMEERTMKEQFPTQYPVYARRTKMLLPFVV
jgi:protein-S-isoprenylcysteine O-methyltransferase Ste14